MSGLAGSYFSLGIGFEALPSPDPGMGPEQSFRTTRAIKGDGGSKRTYATHLIANAEEQQTRLGGVSNFAPIAFRERSSCRLPSFALWSAGTRCQLNPDAVHDHGQPAHRRHSSPSSSRGAGNLHGPRHGPNRSTRQIHRALEVLAKQSIVRHLIATARYFAAPIDLARLIPGAGSAFPETPTPTDLVLRNRAGTSTVAR